jgi:hopene-associated glycosyltransferase HpnB
VVPARDEAETIGRCLRSLLAQEYRGAFRVILVDDGSNDGTVVVARKLADPRLTIIDAPPRPPGWSGKLWALSQGVAATEDPFVLLTDADIVHDPAHVATLVAQAERSGVDMVSEMVALNCSSLAERMLVPAFVYFFQLLYPFAWVNAGLRATAAAAGGTVLIRADALASIGGLDAMRGALIDDVTLAGLVKTRAKIWLGHSALASSIRPYPQPIDVWRMVARTAYVQLGYSPLMLVATLAGMVLVCMVPPYATLFGEGWGRLAGLLAWAAAAGAYVPTLRRFGCSMLWAPFLPAVALFYTAATLGSAFNHYFGRGVIWKQRAYGQTE